LPGRPDGSWVTVGGIVSACKKIRTKSGTQMMFATLDDIEGQVEMLVFKADQSESATVIAPDTVVLVRGRLDHKERGETKLVVQEAESFEPDEEEIAASAGDRGSPAGPLKLTIEASMLSANPELVDELKAVFEHHKGDSSVHLAVSNGEGEPKLWKLGDEFRVRPSGRLRAELNQMLGPDSLAA
jgi:DNA polymerase-3 subunit alpha